MSKIDDVDSDESVDKDATSLSEAVEQCLNSYFEKLNGEVPTDLFSLVTSEVERPLLKVVMAYCDGNQSKAADVLGINRNTLRSKLQNHKFL